MQPRIYISPLVLEITREHLKKYGDRSLESMVIWSGVKNYRDDYLCNNVLIPEQRCFPKRVKVMEKAWYKLGHTLYSLGQEAIAQVHSHPSYKIHPSKLDEMRLVVDRAGFICIIVLNYGCTPWNLLEGCSIHELRRGRLEPLGPKEIERRFIILEHKVEIR